MPISQMRKQPQRLSHSVIIPHFSVAGIGFQSPSVRMRIHLNTMSYVCLLPYHTKQRSGVLQARDDLILNIGYLEYSELTSGFSGLPRASQEESSYHLAGLKLRYKERQMGDEALVDGWVLPRQTSISDQATTRRPRACCRSRMLLGDK